MDISNSEFLAVTEAVTLTKHSGQFCHVATYSRRVSTLSGKVKKSDATKPQARRPTIWTVADIAAEADRADSKHIPHVLKPAPPNLICGSPVSDLVMLCDEVLADSKQANGRALRTDTHVLLAAVYSIDVRASEYEQNKERCDKFILDSIAWHAKMYGKVVSAITHTDEGFFHAHIYSISQDARGMIPGWRAKRDATALALSEGKSKNDANRAGNSAYKKAMIEVQDSYFFEVGSVNGLARYGNRRMRYQPGTGESITKKREREAFCAREIIVREEEAINRTKLASAVLEQERLNAALAKSLEENRAKQKQLVDLEETLQRRRDQADETGFYLDSQVENLHKTPEFIKEEERKNNAKLLNLANERIMGLEESVIQKNFYIDELLDIIAELKKKLKRFIDGIW